MSELPLIPLGGLRIVAGQEGPAPLRGASVALAYWKGWGWLLVLSLAMFAFISSPEQSLGLASVISVSAVGLFELYVWSCWSLGRSREKRRRAVGALLLLLPGAALAFGLWLALQEHIGVQERRCLAGKLDQCAEAARKYDQGIDVPRDRRRATELYARACAGGDSHACKQAAPPHHR